MRLMTTVAFTAALCGSLAACQLTTSHEDPSTAIAPSPLSTATLSTATLSTAAQSWYQAGQDAVEQARQRQIDNRRGAAKNVILFVGDGMGISTITASRILAGQQLGLKGEEHNLSWDQFPYSGLVKTYNTNQQTPDSAGTMTAMMTGVKSKAGFIGVSETVVRGDCQQYLEQGEPLVTALELAKLAGKKTGIVSTARITHATPAATYAKSPERGWESDADFENNEAELGCVDIARQLIEFPQTFAERFGVNKANPLANTIDVVFGGGRRAFYGSDPANLTQFAQQANEGKRKDNRNLIAEWQQQGGLYVSDRQAMNQLTSQPEKPILGLFNPSHMRYEADRSGNSQEPSLTDMTTKAIELLANDEQGYFLMVEAGRIDHGHHAGSAYNALTDAVELSEAVAEALRLTDASETLIIVTADHSHVMTMSGYPTRGNPILGKVIGNDSQGNPATKPVLALDGLPYTTLGYYNGRGHTHVPGRTNGGLRYKEPVFAGRHDLCEVDTTDSGFHQEALVPLKSETHGGEDVGVYANGPGAHLLSGTIEQNVIFHVMNHVADLSGQAQQQLQAQH